MEREDQKVTLALRGLSGFKRVVKDDFVISLRSFQGGIEHSAYDGCVSPAYTVLRAKASLHPRYFFYTLKSDPYIAALQSVTDGIRDGKTISYDQFGSIELPFPTLREQTAIAAFLDRETVKIDELVEEQDRLIELLKAKRQAVISHAVTKGLNPDAPMKDSGVEWLGEVPEHWKVTPLKYFARVGNGSTPNRQTKSYWDGGVYPWLNSSVVNSSVVDEAAQFVTEDALRECHLPIVEPPAVLVGITGQGRTRGMAALLTIEATINQHVAYIKPTKESVSCSYLLSFFEAAYAFLRAESEAGSTKGAITCEQLSRLIVPLPPSSEQAAINSTLEMATTQLDALVVQASTAIDLLQERRSALISAAVTGKIDVRGLIGAETEAA